MKKFITLAVISLALAGCQANNANSNANLPVNDSNSNLNNNEKQVMPQTEEINATKAIIKTNVGEITVKFYNEDAKKTVANFIKLSSEGFYDDTKFHRVIKDFMIQGGDPLSKNNTLKNRWGTGGPGYDFEDEINSHKLIRGSLAMANSGPNTNGSQFFIVTAKETPWLDGKHTNFGEVVSGMDVVDIIEGLKTEGPDRPVQDVIIESIELK